MKSRRHFGRSRCPDWNNCRKVNPPVYRHLEKYFHQCKDPLCSRKDSKHKYYFVHPGNSLFMTKRGFNKKRKRNKKIRNSRTRKKKCRSSNTRRKNFSESKKTFQRTISSYKKVDSPPRSIGRKPQKSRVSVERPLRLHPRTVHPRKVMSNTKLKTQIPLIFHTNVKYWTTVQSQLSGKIRNFRGLRNLMVKLCGRGTRNFKNLDAAIKLFGERYFYSKVLPRMIRLLKSSPDVLPKNCIRFLHQGQTGSVILTRLQCSVVLVNAFFSTFLFYNKIRYVKRKNSKGNKYKLPNINFKKLFNMPCEPQILQKIICFLHYFDTVTNRCRLKLNETIRYERLRILRHQKNFSKFTRNEMCTVIVLKNGKIESTKNARQIDFANKFLGGGVLGHGCVQEEIRFSVNPECVASMVMFPCLLDTEAVLIQGTEQYSTYSGYSRSFRWRGDHDDRMYKTYEICAIDALNFSSGTQLYHQFSKKGMEREIWKSYVGFRGGRLPRIATGHWGCGAFRGNKGLKFVVQWIASSMAGKELHYYCFESGRSDVWFRKFKRFVTFVVENGYNVGDLLEAIDHVEVHVRVRRRKKRRGKQMKKEVEILKVIEEFLKREK